MAREVHAPTGTQLTCKNWLIEAPYRMIQNNLDPMVAFDPDNLIVYGGRGKAARNWASFDAINAPAGIATAEVPAFFCVFGIHAGSYIGGTLGTVVAVIRVVSLRSAAA